MSRQANVDLLVISGAAGVGKSTTAFEASTQLRNAGVPHAVIDADALDRVYPVPTDLPRLTERNLRSVWQSFREYGIQRLIVTGVYLHREDELEWIRRATHPTRTTVVRLTASVSTLAERVRLREIGSAQEAQIERTLKQASEFELQRDTSVHVLPTDGVAVHETAGKVLEITGWV